ncbi:MAG: hypothetical protein V4532_07635, partial [Pseudomonadota bacterium]
MTAIVAGQGLGLQNTSANVLGGPGQIGVASQGRSGESVLVNATTGNLVVQQQDEWLVGAGPDTSILRTYNSLATSDGDNNDNWRLGLSRKIKIIAMGSTVSRIGEDGAELTYTWDANEVAYVCKSGGGSYDLIRRNSSTKWTWTDGGSGATETYETSTVAGEFRLTHIIDSNQKQVSLGYVASTDLISTITNDTDQEVITITYDVGANARNIKSITSAYTKDGVTTTPTKRVTYDYDTNTPSSRLIKVSVDLTPDNSISDGAFYFTSYTYDSTSNRLASITQTDGSKLTFEYDSANGYKIKSVKEYASASDIRETKFAYDAGTGATTITDPLLQQTVLTYDTSGPLLSIKAPPVGTITQTTTFGYDANGNVDKVIDARGNTTTYRYDGHGNRTYERDGQGNVVERAYALDSNLLLSETLYTAIDPDQDGVLLQSGPLSTHYVYDSSRNLRFSISPTGQVTQHVYTAGQRTSTMQYSAALYNATDFTEGTLNTWATDQAAKSTRTDYAYDFRGQLSTQTSFATVDASGAGITSDNRQTVIQYIYDQAGNLLNKIVGLADNTEQTSYTYDGLNRITSTTDGEGSLNGYKQSVTLFDDANRSTKVTLANGLVTTSVYDKAGRLLSVSRAENGVTPLGTTNYTYDKLGRLTCTTSPEGEQNFIVYDSASRKVGEVDAEGALTEYRYNAGNQLVRTIRYNSKLVQTKLDALLLEATKAGVALSTLIPTGLSSDRNSWTIYDKAGRVVATVIATGNNSGSDTTELGQLTEYRYDGSGRLTDTIGYSTGISAANMLLLRAASAELAFGNKKIVAGSTTTPVDIVVVSSTSGDRRTRNYYSNDGQLVGQLDAGNYYTAHVYDAAGRLSKSTRYAKAIAGTVAEGNTPPTPVATLPYQMLDIGADQTTTYLYNARSQLIGVQDPEGFYTAYQYDSAGNKTQETRYNNAITREFDGKTAPILVAIISGQIPVSGSYIQLHGEDQTSIYGFDANNRLIRTESKPSGLVSTFEYDKVGNLLKTTKALGVAAQVRIEQHCYDQLGRMTTELSGAGNAALKTWLTNNPSASQQAIADQTKLVWKQYGLRHQYDKSGHRIATIEPNGIDGTDIKTIYYYDNNGRLSYSINALGETTGFTYNSFGEQSDRIQYANRLAGVGSMLGGLKKMLNTTTWASTEDNTEKVLYNRLGLAHRKFTDGKYTLIDNNEYTYSIFGQLYKDLSTTSSAGIEKNLLRSYFYDRRGFEKRAITQDFGLDSDGLGVTVLLKDATSTYDAFGRLIHQPDPKGSDTARYYDRLGRVVQINEPGSTGSTGLARKIGYDAFGRVLTQTDPSGSATSYVHDSANGTVTITTPEGLAAGFSTLQKSNLHGETTTITDGRGNITTYTYNADGRLLDTTLTAKDGTTVVQKTSTVYDMAGRVSESFDARGQHVTNSYDAANRVLKRTVKVDGVDLSTDYRYDAKGNAVWERDPAGVWTQTEFDRKDHVLAIVVDPKQIPQTTSTALGIDQTIALIDNPATGGGLALRTEFTYDTDGHTLTVTEAASSDAPKTTQ